MDIYQNIKLRCDAALLTIAVKIEEAAIAACGHLGIQAEMEVLHNLQLKRKLESPLFVSSIRFDGKITLDMYDHAPGFAYFTRDHSMVRHIEHELSLSLAKTIAVNMLAELQNSNKAEDRDEDRDGAFYPTSIVLLSQFHDVIQEFDGKKWLDKLPNQSEFESVQASIKELKSEAFKERGWDNYSTADSLDWRADCMQRRLDIGRNITRVVQ